MSTRSILFVFTSADKALDGKPIGWYLPEAAHPYHVLAPHFNIVGVSPKGGEAPIDHSSVENFNDEQGKHFMEDAKASKIWKETKKFSEINPEDFAAIFIVGGHGPIIDLAKDEEFAKVVEAFYAAKKPVSAVCHGPGGLVLAKKPNSTESILSGAEVTGFSNDEEAQTPFNDFINILPFSLEDRIKQLGGKYSKGENWSSHVVWSNGILTGQNPASAAGLGEKLKEILG